MLTYKMWYDSISGHSPQKGDQEAARAIMLEFQMMNNQRAMKIYAETKAWPARVPYTLMKLAFSSLAVGNSKYFDLVFIENDTFMSVDGLQSMMEAVERPLPWLHWTDLVNWKDLLKQHLVSPKFLKTLYKFDPSVRATYDASFLIKC